MSWRRPAIYGAQMLQCSATVQPPFCPAFLLPLAHQQQRQWSIGPCIRSDRVAGIARDSVRAPLTGTRDAPRYTARHDRAVAAVVVEDRGIQVDRLTWGSVSVRWRHGRSAVDDRFDTLWRGSPPHTWLVDPGCRREARAPRQSPHMPGDMSPVWCPGRWHRNPQRAERTGPW